MMNIIKTALVTIIISIISGLLLEHFKNLAPRILCNVEDGVPTEMDNKKFYAYIITVSNLSKKIIHELTLNIQSPQDNLKFSDAKITKGLKFDSSMEDNILDIDIPFLSKGDKFSVTVYVENHKRPVIVMRSPENFKQVDSLEQNGVLSSLFNKSENIDEEDSNTIEENETIIPDENNDYTIIMDKVPDYKKTTNKKSKEKLHGNKKLGNIKKAMIIGALVIVVLVVGVLVKFCLKGAPASTQSPSVKTDVDKNSTDATKSIDKTTKNADTKTPSGGTTKNADTKTPASETTRNTDTKATTGGTTGGTDTKATTGGTTGNVDTKPSTDGTTKNTDTKTPTDDPTKNTDTKTPTDGTTKNTDTNAPTNETNGNN